MSKGDDQVWAAAVEPQVDARSAAGKDVTLYGMGAYLRGPDVTEQHIPVENLRLIVGRQPSAKALVFEHPIVGILKKALGLLVLAGEATDAEKLGVEAGAILAAEQPSTAAARDVLAERRRQVESEGWTPEYDDQHDIGEMALAAGCYAANAGGAAWADGVPKFFPWTQAWWKPTTPRRDIVDLLFDADQPLADHKRVSLLMAVHGSAQALIRGNAPRIVWHDITNALNIAQILCEGAGNSEVGLEVIFDAQNAMIAVGERCHAVGRLGASGDEIRAINNGIALYEQLLETVTKRQYTNAINEGIRRLKAGDVVKLQRAGTPRMTTAQIGEAA